MRKLFYIFATLLTLSVTSCKKDVNPPDNVPQGAFLATISNESARNIPISDGKRTMTYINDNRNVYWYERDIISVNNSIYTLEKVDGAGYPAVFKNENGTLPEKDGGYYKAIYPSTGYTLPATQNGEFNNVPMYAQSETEYLKFDIITAVLKIVVPAGISNAKLITVSANKALSGAFTVEDPETNPHAVMTDTETAGYLQIEGTFSANDIVYVPIPAGEYSQLGFKIYQNSLQDDLPLISKTMHTKNTFQVNKIYTVRIDNYFCFTSLASSSVTYKGNNSLEYLKNSGDWRPMTKDSLIGLVKDDKLFIKATDTYNTIGIQDNPAFVLTGNVKVSGILLYLLNNIASDTDFGSNSTTSQFQYLFKGQTALTDASELILPYCTPTSKCYQGMFMDCTGLTAAPVLPTTNLAIYCYSLMFSGCTALTSAPELPATTMVASCYHSMFKGCTALTTAPDLPALTLAENCYQSMFEGCSNLSSVTMKATTVSATDCLQHWLDNAGTSATSPTLKVDGTMTNNSVILTNTPNTTSKTGVWTIESIQP